LAALTGIHSARLKMAAKGGLYDGTCGQMLKPLRNEPRPVSDAEKKNAPL